MLFHYQHLCQEMDKTIVNYTAEEGTTPGGIVKGKFQRTSVRSLKTAQKLQATARSQNVGRYRHQDCMHVTYARQLFV